MHSFRVPQPFPGWVRLHGEKKYYTDTQHDSYRASERNDTG
uniref:Uncharacterized protein n=1 Tax=Anopheles minimus TaxID=112268 RepID=A0A182WP91_9DIPT